MDAHGYVRVKFADALKNMARSLLMGQGVTAENTEQYIEGGLKELPTHYFAGASPRIVMQGLGEWGRAIDPDFWAMPAVTRTRGLLRGGCSVIIDDCRHPNEAKFIEDLGGAVIKIVGRVPTTVAPKHVSEEPLPDYLISDTLNNGAGHFHAYKEVRRLVNSDQGYIK